MYVYVYVYMYMYIYTAAHIINNTIAYNYNKCYYILNNIIPFVTSVIYLCP